MSKHNNWWPFAKKNAEVEPVTFETIGNWQLGSDGIARQMHDGKPSGRQMHLQDRSLEKRRRCIQDEVRFEIAHADAEITPLQPPSLAGGESDWLWTAAHFKECQPGASGHDHLDSSTVTEGGWVMSRHWNEAGLHDKARYSEERLLRWKGFRRSRKILLYAVEQMIHAAENGQPERVAEIGKAAVVRCGARASWDEPQPRVPDPKWPGGFSPWRMSDTIV